MPDFWQLEITCDPALVAPLSDWLSSEAVAEAPVSITELVPKAGSNPKQRQLQAVYVTEPALPTLQAGSAVLATALGTSLPLLQLQRLPATDWLAAVAQKFPPLPIGRLTLHSNPPLPANSWARPHLLLLATNAFGTGEHPTTRLCLELLQQSLKATRPNRMLDVGCGTGVLALAALRLGVLRALASDLDPACIAATVRHARLNGLHPRIRTTLGAGLQPAVLRRQHYPLIMANLFARPLCQLAPALAARLAPNARLIVSGLLTSQANQVKNALRQARLTLRQERRRDDWSALLFYKKA